MHVLVYCSNVSSTIRILYFCERRYCPKDEYFTTTVDEHLHKQVPLQGNTCQLKPDITEHGSILQYATFEVSDFVKSYGTRLPEDDVGTFCTEGQHQHTATNCHLLHIIIAEQGLINT